MEENFRIIDGDELFGNRKGEEPASDNYLWWWGVGILGVVLLGACGWMAFEIGRQSVMPKITDASDKNNQSEKRILSNSQFCNNAGEQNDKPVAQINSYPHADCQNIV